MPDTLTTTIGNYIEGQLRDQGDDIDLAAEDDLVMVGFDSIAYVRLVSFIKATYGVAVPDADVTIEQFGTVANIAAYLEGRGVAPPDSGPTSPSP